MTGLAFPTREEWLAARQSRIGGSEVAALFGVQAEYQQSLYALWQIKSGRIPSPDVAGGRPEWGLRLEAAIAEGAAERHGWEIEKGGYVVHLTVEGMACTLDFVITGYDKLEKEATWGTPPVALEIKNTDWMIHKKQWGDEPPIHVQLQLQHQLACTGYQSGIVQCLIGGNELAEPYAFERRPKIIAEIEKRVTAFWQSIRDNKPPPVDGSETTGAALAAMFPEHVPGKDIDLTGDNEFPGRFAEFKQSRIDRLSVEAGEKAAKNWLMAKIGDAELIRYAGQIVATCKAQHRKGYHVEPSSSRVLRLKEK